MAASKNELNHYVKHMFREVKDSKAVNCATLGILGLATVYEATAFGGDISNTAALGVVTGAQFNRLVAKYKVKV